MRSTGRQSYCDETEKDYDIDHVISAFVEKIKLLLQEIKDETKTLSQERQVFKAIMSELIDKLE